MITRPVDDDDLPVIEYRRRAAGTLIEVLKEVAISGSNMGCDIPLSIFEDTRQMSDLERSDVAFDHIVGAYGLIQPVVPYSYNLTAH